MITKCTKTILGRVLVTNLQSGIAEMTNLRTDEIAIFCILTKISTDENKAIYSICIINYVIESFESEKS